MAENALTADEINEVRALLAEHRRLAAERAERDATWPQRMEAMVRSIAEDQKRRAQSASLARA